MTENVREAVYRAEQILRKMLDNADVSPFVQIHGSKVYLSPDRKFGDLDSIQRYVDAVLALNWMQATYPNAKRSVTVRERKGDNFAHYQLDTIAVPIKPRGDLSRWAMRELVVLHELAHHLDKNSGHSETFTAVFLDLIGQFMSMEASWILRSLFNDEGVSIA